MLEFEVTIVYDKDTTIQTISWGEEIELNAKDNTDRHFVQWQDGLVENPRNVTIISDTTFVAEYADSYVNVAVAANQWYTNRLSLRPIKRVPTAVDNAVAGSTTTKLMLNGQLYIVRDGKMFTVQGTQAK